MVVGHVRQVVVLCSVILLGWTCEWSLWRGGHFIEVIFKTGLTIICEIFDRCGEISSKHL